MNILSVGATPQLVLTEFHHFIACFRVPAYTLSKKTPELTESAVFWTFCTCGDAPPGWALTLSVKTVC
jgi:hypothetical protein